jgi:hypothetical protein
MIGVLNPAVAGVSAPSPARYAVGLSPGGGEARPVARFLFALLRKRVK